VSAKEQVLRALRGEKGAVPWIEIETRDELTAAALGLERGSIGWEERVAYALETGLDAVGFAHWDRFGCDIVHSGDVLGFIPRIASRDDLPKLSVPSPEQIDYESLRQRVEEAAAAVQGTGLALFVAHPLCFDPVVMDMGLAAFSIALYEDQPLLHEMMRRYTAYYSALDDFYSNQPEIDLIWVGEDIAYSASTMISPEMLRDLVFPYFAEITGCIRKPWIYHSDGNIWDVIPDLLKLGMHALHPIEPTAMDIDQVRETYGRETALVGNVDVSILAAGTAEETAAAVRSVMDRCGPGGGYLLSSGNSLTHYVKPENVRVMGETKRAWNREHGF
jgi:hypothetical protein